jgi:hypothetical protein
MIQMREQPSIAPRKCLSTTRSTPASSSEWAEHAVVGLPRVERVRGLQDRAVALGGLDLLGDGGDDAVDDRVDPLAT